MTVVTDAILDGLEEVHGAMLRAGLAHVAGDEAGALGELVDAQRVLDDVVADIRRDLADPEPEAKRCSQLAALPGESFEDIFTGGAA